MTLVYEPGCWGKGGGREEVAGSQDMAHVCTVGTGTIPTQFMCCLALQYRHSVFVYDFISVADPDPAIFVSDFQGVNNKKIFVF